MARPESPLDTLDRSLRALRPEVEPGTVIGNHFRVVRVIGAGGMSTVHLAWDSKHRRDVALKIIETQVSADPVAAQIEHPNIIPVYDSGRYGDFGYVVLKYLKPESGKMLNEIIRGGPMAPRDAIRVLVQLADALRTAHDADVVHRDVKPSNVFIGNDLRVTLIDFGIASDPIDLSQLARNYQIAGTPSYMAPEQFRGRAGKACDIFALGLLAGATLLGRHPRDSMTTQYPEAAGTILSTPPVGQRRLALPLTHKRRLDAFLMLMIDLDEVRRPRAAEVHEWFLALQADLEHHKTIRRRVVVLAFAFLILLAGLLGYADLDQARREREAVDALESARAEIAQGQQWRGRTHLLRALDLSPTDGVLNYWAILEDPLESQKSTGIDAYHATFAVDGHRLLAGTVDHRLITYEIPSLKVLRTVEYDDAVASAAFSTDGKLMAVGGRFGLALGDRELSSEGLGKIHGLVFDDDRRLLAASEKSLVRFGSILSPESREVILAEATAAVDVIRGQGVYLAGGFNGILTAIKAEMGTVLWSHRASGEIHSIGVCADDFFIVGHRFGAEICDLNTRTCDSLPTQGHKIRGVAIHPGCQRDQTGKLEKAFVGLSTDQGVELLSVEEMARYQPLPGGAYSVEFSRGGKYFATAGSEGVRLYDAALLFSEMRRPTPAHNRPIRGIRFVPGDETLLTLSLDGTLRAWRAVDGLHLREIPIGLQGFSLDLLETTDDLRCSRGGGFAYVAAAAGDNDVVMLGGRTNAPRDLRILGRWRASVLAITDVTFMLDGRVITSAEDGLVRVWCPRWDRESSSPQIQFSVVELARLDTPGRDEPNLVLGQAWQSAVVSDEGDIVATAFRGASHQNPILRAIGSDQPQIVRTFPFSQLNFVTGIASRPRSQDLLWLDIDGNVSYWRQNDQAITSLGRVGSSTLYPVWHPKEDFVLLPGKEASVWFADFRLGLPSSWARIELAPLDGDLNVVAFSHDGGKFAAGGDAGQVAVFQMDAPGRFRPAWDGPAHPESLTEGSALTYGVTGPRDLVSNHLGPSVSCRVAEGIIAHGFDDGSVGIWIVDSGQKLWSTRLNGRVSRLWVAERGGSRWLHAESAIGAEMAPRLLLGLQRPVDGHAFKSALRSRLGLGPAPQKP